MIPEIIDPGYNGWIRIWPLSRHPGKTWAFSYENEELTLIVSVRTVFTILSADMKLFLIKVNWLLGIGD